MGSGTRCPWRSPSPPTLGGHDTGSPCPYVLGGVRNRPGSRAPTGTPQFLRFCSHHRQCLRGSVRVRLVRGVEEEVRLALSLRRSRRRSRREGRDEVPGESCRVVGEWGADSYLLSSFLKYHVGPPGYGTGPTGDNYRGFRAFPSMRGWYLYSSVSRRGSLHCAGPS